MALYPGESRPAASAASAAMAVAAAAAAAALRVSALASSTAAKEMTRSAFEDVVACAVAGVADAGSSVRRIAWSRTAVRFVAPFGGGPLHGF